jgi:uncharacterized phosphosugar-binding protein
MSSSLGRWLKGARGLIDHLETTQLEAIETAAGWCAQSIGAGGLVHLFGSGHSRIPVEEMFPRYGSYPGFHPMVELSMTFHTQVIGSNGQPQAMFIERVEGLAQVILDSHRFLPQDLMIVFSASGRSAVPIEVAIGARERGLRVIGVTSVPESLAQEPSHSSGTRLLDNCDLVIDIGTPPGDALVALEGLSTPVGPGSTLANVAVVNELKVRTAELLIAAGHPPKVLTSSTLVGREASDRLFTEAYDEHRRRVSRI